MNRWKMRGVAALAVLSLAIAGCQNQGSDASVDALDSSPSMDMTAPSGGSMDMESSPSLEASPDES